MKNGRAHAIGWAAAIIGALVLLRMAKGAGDPPYGVDASYYFQLARHVMRGEGLVTTVSLYQEGWVPPARTPIYPLWPLILGYSGRVVGLERAADLLPRIFYAIDLVLLYVLARAIALRAGALRIGERWYVPDCAHWMVAVFGLAPRFFGATTHPYTEGVAFAAAFASLIALERFERTRGVGAAAASGVFAGLAFLARTQMAGVVLGCFLALVWFALRDRRMRAGAAVWSVIALATVVPWFFHIGGIPGILPPSLPRVELPAFSGWIEPPTRAAWLADRALSLGVMFDPSSPYSYVQSFGVVAYLVPLAALAALAALVRRRFAAPRSMLLMAVFTAGVLFFVNLMTYHSHIAAWRPWLFGWRHGLTYIFLIALAVPWLALRAGRFAMAVALVLLISVATNARNVAMFVRSPDPELAPAEQELVRWLETHRVAAITTNAQILGSVSDTHLYWTHCEAPAESTRAMLRKLPVRHIVLYERERSCPFVSGDPLRVVAAFGEEGRRVFVLQAMR